MLRAASLPALWIAVLLSVAPITRAADVVIAPNNHNLVYMGRFSNDYRFGWTGCAIRMSFIGSTVSARLQLVQGDAAAMQIIIDGVPTHPLFLSKTQDQYVLASDLAPGMHTIELFKRTESSYGEIKFDGFILPPGAQVEKLMPQTRKILIFGDSITCGYGNESTSPKHKNGLKLENGYMSYAAIAARRVHAQIMMICWSGRGMYRNYYVGKDRQGTLPKLFDRTLPLESDPVWNQQEYIPQLIVINLGTNDLVTDNGKKAPLTAPEFLAVYDQFLNRLHKFFPQAQVLATIGPILDKPVSDWLQTLPEKYNFVHTLIFTDRNPAEDRSASMHPSILGDIKMADELIPAIRNLMHWKCPVKTGHIKA